MTGIVVAPADVQEHATRLLWKLYVQNVATRREMKSLGAPV